MVWWVIADFVSIVMYAIYAITNISAIRNPPFVTLLQISNEKDYILSLTLNFGYYKQNSKWEISFCNVQHM